MLEIKSMDNKILIVIDEKDFGTEKPLVINYISKNNSKTLDTKQLRLTRKIKLLLN